MAVGRGESRPVEIDEQHGFPSTGLDSPWVLFALLLFPKARYSAQSHFTTEIFICQVICVYM